MRSRKLVLRKETLGELSSDMLERVVVGNVLSLGCALLGPSFECTRRIDCINDISFEVCPTLAMEVCLRSELVCTIQTGR